MRSCKEKSFPVRCFFESGERIGKGDAVAPNICFRRAGFLGLFTPYFAGAERRTHNDIEWVFPTSVDSCVDSTSAVNWKTSELHSALRPTKLGRDENAALGCIVHSHYSHPSLHWIAAFARESCKSECERIVTRDCLGVLNGFAARAGALRLQLASALPGAALEAARPRAVFPFRPSPPDCPSLALRRAEPRVPRN